MAINPFKAFYKDTAAYLKTMTTTGFGKGAVEAFYTGAANSLPASIIGSVVVGGFGLVSMVTNHMDYLHEREKIADFYRDEIAAKTGKDVRKVHHHDLNHLERGNNRVEPNSTIKQALSRERGNRNLGIGVSMIASLAVFSLITAVTGNAHTAILSLGTAAKIGVGVLSYMAIKEPLQGFGRKILGMENETAHEKILHMARDRNRGNVITREQVVEVFIAANKNLANYVKDHFDVSYEGLALADKVKVADEISKLIPVDAMVQNINLGTTNVSELAFTVDGQISGVLPKPPEQRVHSSLLDGFKYKIRSMMDGISGLGSERTSLGFGAASQHSAARHKAAAENTHSTSQHAEAELARRVQRVNMSGNDLMH